MTRKIYDLIMITERIKRELRNRGAMYHMLPSVWDEAYQIGQDYLANRNNG